VYDPNNNALSGVLVAFSTDQGTLSPVSATTNGFGQAQTILTTNQAATVTGTVGAKSGTVKVTTNAVPTVSLTGPTTTPTAGLSSTFTLTVAPGSGAAPIRSVIVTFGDGSSVNLGAATGTISVPHVFLTDGTFTVTATATDSSGQSSSTAVPIVVFASVPFTLTVTAPGGRVGVAISATAVPSAGSPAIISYTFDFGDGTAPVPTAVGTASHIYASIPSGYTSYPFTITVQAVGADGRRGIGSTSVLITP
jgi:hypothetical protein